MKKPSIPHLDVWQINEADYPKRGGLAERLRFLLRYAILAPSSHNAQPWLFSLNDGAVEIYADRSRSLRATDPEDRQMIIACGCALFHLRVAMEHFGSRPEVERFPEPANPDLLARVRPGRDVFSSDENEKLFDAIPRRRTCRHRFKDEPVPHEIALELAEAVSRSNGWLYFVEAEDKRRMLADLIAEGDRIQWEDDRFRRELADWTRPDSVSAGVGLPHYALDANDLLTYAETRVLRTFDLGDGQAAKDHEIALYSPALCVLGTAYDNPRAWLEAGEALAHLLLLATHYHLHASFLNQPIEVADLRPRVARLIGTTGIPQLILRMGYGAPINPTPRRTVDEVLF